MRHFIENETPFDHRHIPIRDCGEPLVAIPRDGRFHFAEPHVYEVVGAPYPEGTSPFSLRSGVLKALERAALLLGEFHPGYRLKVYDAYRPLEVQAFMVQHVADSFCRKVAGILLSEAEDDLRDLAYALTHRLWAPATDDPTAPPPHSTGAAVDVTIVDEA